MPESSESSRSTTKATTRFGGRARLAAVSLALVALPFGLTLFLVKGRWAPLLRADSAAATVCTVTR